MWVELRDWIGWIAEIVIAVYVVREFYYDRDKDIEKKHRRTKTTKKTTSKAGESIVEESTETSEPVQENKNERDESKV